MPQRKRQTEEESVAADDPHTSPNAPTPAASPELAEYTLPDGSTYLLSAEEAERRGAKAHVPANKAVTPSNK